METADVGSIPATQADAMQVQTIGAEATLHVTIEMAKRHCVRRVLLVTWKKGTAARFFRLSRAFAKDACAEVRDLDSVFR
jgi:hypothetical protein